MEKNSKKIRLGICMAGAVSAGAYTAGVVDYLIETLERWEQRKKQIRHKKNGGIKLTPEDELVPMHDVVIEVLSGSSAGGMTAAVLSYSFNDGTYLTRREASIINGNYDLPDEADTPTKLYDAWINMMDEDHSTTFKKLMDPSDVVGFGEMKSLLNSKAIDDIAENAIPEKINFQPPGYISEHLNILLSVTNLEGIPFDINFTNVEDANPTRNVLTTHSGFLHYKFKKEERIDYDYPPMIISENNKNRLAFAAMATGAFPFGLPNRVIEIDRKHFEKFKRIMRDKNMNLNLNLPENSNYIFTAVDGGAINNEPISATFRMLHKKKDAYHPKDDDYVILVDPFPTVTNATRYEEHKHPSEEGYSLKDQFFKLIKAFRNESSFKQEEFHESHAGKERYLISPAKKGFYFLACGPIEGFGGFMKKAFRKHDYQLGRKNCQTFLRYYFGEDPKKYTDLTGIELTPEQLIQWRYDANYRLMGQENYKENYKIPLIPDMIFFEKPETDEIEFLNKNTKAQLLKVRTEITEPAYDGLTTEELSEISSNIKQRITRITDKSYSDIKKGAKKANWWLGKFTIIFSRMVKKKIIKFTSGKVEAYLLKTFLAQSVKQDELVKNFIQIIVQGGKFQKTEEVKAIIADGGERVVSFIDRTEVKKAKNKDIKNDKITGIEDWDIAKAGEYIVTNGTRRQEQYVVAADKFEEKYQLVEGDRYKPNDKAQVYALQISALNIKKYQMRVFDKLIANPMNPVYIEPIWKQSQSVHINDYLVTPSVKKDEVYCIKKNDFEDTYTEIE
jgi:hypothetical protein